MPSPTPHYRAFISYSHRDAKWAKWLHRSLEKYVVPIDAFAEGEKLEADGTEKSRRLTPIFRDRDELPASGSLSDTIQQALESSENLIVLCSPNSAASQYVNAEIETFRGLHPDNDKKIYALIIEGEPPDCFPPALIADGAEPIAADAREEGDGKSGAKLKLIAGMLGVGFDRLKQREAKRQRNRLLVIVSVISAVAVMTSVLALWALKAEQEAIKQKELALQSARESKAVLKFFESNVLAVARPKGQFGGLGVDVTIRAAIDAAEPQIAVSFSDQALVESSIRQSLGTTYGILGKTDAAIAQRERALELKMKVLGKEHPATLGSMNQLGISYRIAGRYEEALSLLEKATVLQKKILGNEHPATLGSMNTLAGIMGGMNREAEAISLLEELLTTYKKLQGPEHIDTMNSMSTLALLYREQGLKEQALVLLEDALALQKKALGDDHIYTLGSMIQLAVSYRALGRHDDSLALIEKAHALQKNLLGAEHLVTLRSMNQLAKAYWYVNRSDEAILLQAKTWDLQKKVLGVANETTLDSAHTLASFYQNSGKLDEAESILRESITVRKNQNPNDLKLCSDQALLGSTLRKLKQYRESEPLLLTSYEGSKGIPSIRGKAHTKNSIKKLIVLYQDWEKHDKAAEWQAKLDALEKPQTNSTDL